jgi:hypothetical protein
MLHCSLLVIDGKVPGKTQSKEISWDPLGRASQEL